MNTWNVRSYAPRNQAPAHFEYYRNCSKEKLTVCVRSEVLGPYFFEGNVTGNTNLAIIDNFVVPNSRFEERDNGRLGRGWCVQDGPPAHRARAETSSAEPALWKSDSIARQEHKWPPRSPDLTPLDFLWGQGPDFQNTPNVDELRERIANEYVALRRTRMPLDGP